MEKIMTDFKSIKVVSNVKKAIGQKKVYGVLGQDGSWYTHEVNEIPAWARFPGIDVKEAVEQREKQANSITNASGDYINGFRVVQFESGKFGYIDESGKVIPRYFDIAGNFNEFGLAMVAENGSVSWINKDFQVLNCHWDEGNQEFIQSMTHTKLSSSNGYTSVEEFDVSLDNPLAAVELNWNGCPTHYFLNTIGEIQRFIPYPELNDEDARANVRAGFQQKPEFKTQGFAIVDNILLFPNGHFVSIKKFFDIMRTEGINPERLIKKNIKESKTHIVMPK